MRLYEQSLLFLKIVKNITFEKVLVFQDKNRYCTMFVVENDYELTRR